MTARAAPCKGVLVRSGPAVSAFVHLHVHTQFSFLTSSVQVAELGRRAAELGMPAVAITDAANMYGAIKHWKTCKAAGVQPIIGCELNVARADGRGLSDHLVLLAASQEGYQNLVHLVSRGHLHPQTERPSVTLQDVAQRAKGLVALTGCLGGVLAQRVLEQGPEVAEPSLAELRDLFEPGHLFVELQDHGFPEQKIFREVAQRAAGRLGLPLVATNDVHCMKREDAEALLYLDAVRLGRGYGEVKEGHHGSAEMFLKSPAEMAQAFAELPEALSNTLRVAELCSGLELRLGTPMLPTFPVPEGYDTDAYFRERAHAGLEQRFQEFRAAAKRVDEAAYRQRLEFELGVITQMRYAGYFLIVWDFIHAARRQGIPVGPGRGSGAGSLVAYSLGITDLDPIPYHLLFERFLNPERVSMPDFDVDFCKARRDEVIAYVASKYGAESVGQIATYQNLKARSVLKDVARTMGFPAPEAQRIASLVPDLGQGKTATIDETLEQEPELRKRMEAEPRVAELVHIARQLEGLTRHAGMHAAGVVISEGPLEDWVPVFRSDAAIVTQYDKDDVEAAGLVKFDFLGLKTLTVLDIAQRLVNARPERQGRPLELARLPLDDKDTYQLISSGDTKGVFQLESSGIQEKILRPLKPDCFEDIIAAVALYRPGPLSTGMIDNFIDTKHQRKPIDTLHPLVDGVLAPTYGVPVYQEQVMQIAQQLSGYSLGGADLLRRAMGKKKKEEMDKQLSQFVRGAVERGVSEEQALSIFKTIEGFAGYGFNKSHSAAYALITYQTAYLKAHYPAEFFAATLTADKDKIDKVVRTIVEARAWGVSVLPPDINASEVDFTVTYAHPRGDGPARGPGKVRDRYGAQIRFGLGALRGVGLAALESVFEARGAGGDFKDLFDFAARVDGKRLNKGVLESLVHAGAFDSVLEPRGVSRWRAFAAIDRALERARSASRDRERGQSTLFSMFEAAAPAAREGERGGEEVYPEAEAWDRLELLRRERGALGLYVSGHPLARYGRKLARLGARSTDSLAGSKAWTAVSVAGMVDGYAERVFKGAGGGKSASFELGDEQGRVACKLKGDRIEQYSPLLQSGRPVLVSGKIMTAQRSEEAGAEEGGEGEVRLTVDHVELLEQVVFEATKGLGLRVESERMDEAAWRRLRATLEASPGTCLVELQLQLPAGARAVLALDELRVSPNAELLSQLERQWPDMTLDLR